MKGVKGMTLNLEFDNVGVPSWKACLAQWLEHRFCKPNVIGSSPVVGLHRYIKLVKDPPVRKKK